MAQNRTSEKSNAVRLAARATVIVGGGPAGTALLLAASRHGGLNDLLNGGLAVVEHGPALGAGALGGYAVTSDSTADTFLTSIRQHPLPEFAALSAQPEAQALAIQPGSGGVKLGKVGAFLDMLGGELAKLVRNGKGEVLTVHDALFATSTETGWVTRVRRRADGALFDIPSNSLVIATGGAQTASRLHGTKVAGVRLGEYCSDRLMGADEVLSAGGLARLIARLPSDRAPRIAIVGGSTSAVTAANLLLTTEIGARLEAGGLSLLHRRKLRPFYPSAAAAEADGFTDFGPADICPLSGFVYRLAGFRTEARDLVLAALSIGGRTPDPRLDLLQLQAGTDAQARALLDRADIVIAAIGYRPRALKLRDATGKAIRLAAARPGAAMVDNECRVLDTKGRPLPGVFGLGLAAGFVPMGVLGGEPSFRGQANGLWLWQNAVGTRIVEQICRRIPARRDRELSQPGKPTIEVGCWYARSAPRLSEDAALYGYGARLG